MVSDEQTNSQNKNPQSDTVRSKFSRREWLARRLLKEFVSSYKLIPGRPPIALFVLAVGFAALAIFQFPGEAAPKVEILQTAVPGGAAIFLFVSGHYLSLTTRPAQKQAAAVLMAVLLMTVAAGTHTMVLVLEAGELRATYDWLFGLTAAVSSGAIMGVPIGIGFDSLASYQESLKEKNRHTQQLNQRLRVLNRVMRHNVRNELTVALGSLQFIEADLTSEQNREWYQRAIGSLERLHTHSEKLIRLDSEGLFGTAKTNIDIAGFTRSYLIGDSVGPPEDHVTVDAPEEVNVSAHPLIGSAVAEAIHNAWIHSDTPEITVDISIRPSIDQVTIEIADTGPGIPSIELRALDLADENPLSHGKGVGLWFIKWVVEGSDGTLTLASNEPRGTIVRMQLPHAKPT